MSVEIPTKGLIEDRKTTVVKPLRRGLGRMLAMGGLVSLAINSSGCIEDVDCGICDPDSLILESISGINYASRKIHLVNPPCEGDNCPAPFNKGSYFIETIGPCAETDEAKASPRRAEEYCKLSPLVSTFGIEFVFNNLLEATSVELVRKRPDNPQLYEVYDWKTQVLDIEGPITRYNGDYHRGSNREEPDMVTRLVNLACVDNLAERGIPFSHEDYENPADNPCNTVDPATGLPFKRFENGSLSSYRGTWTAGGNSCSAPQEGPNTCCTMCDFLLSTKVARYGVTPGGEQRHPNYPEFAVTECDGDNDCTGAFRCVRNDPDDALGTCVPPSNSDAAIPCDSANGDPLIECRDFIPFVDRSAEERTYSYFWNNPPPSGPQTQTQRSESSAGREEFPLPYYDLLRETHPDDRPAWLENRTARCNASSECTADSGHNLPGTQCVGQLDDGRACLMGVTPGCTEGRCRPQWFVTCQSNPDTTGSRGFCVDRRFAARSTAACFTSSAPFWGLCDDNQEAEYGLSRCAGQNSSDNLSLAWCDGNTNNLISAGECCQPELQSGDHVQQCDPFYQDQVQPVPRYRRDENLPGPTRRCVCEDEPSDECRRVVDSVCRDDDGNIRPERAGEYAVKFVSRRGGVIYDPAVKGIEWRPAHLGSVPRAGIETCAESRGLVSRRNRHDGWRSNDAFTPHDYVDYDRAMCSASQYRVVFASPEGSDGPIEYLRDKVGNTLAGKTVYTFETPHFHVVPGSGFPTDNLRIGACDAFQLRFSNKFDLSRENLRKLQIWRVVDGELAPPNDQCPNMVPVAGGPHCVDTVEAKDNDPCRPPCLVVDVGQHWTGQVKVRIDTTEFDPTLEVGTRYRFVVPGLGSPDQMSDPELYRAAFWDACGMPLITGGASAPDFIYEFSIDEPKCKEDRDRDDIPRSCDNAPLHFNPGQEDIDFDGFGDVIDLCPTVPSNMNTGDSDRDGVGNQCDNCRQATNQYNRHVAALGNVPAYMYVRNIPYQTDTDGDGIGDVCDNCVVVANCEGFNLNNPWRTGEPIAFEDGNVCQRDDNSNMVGDACEGQVLGANTHMPIGLGPDDDFDQDGIRNVDDACPRQPLEDFIACQVDADCGEHRSCEKFCLPSGDPNHDPNCDDDVGVCNHADTDGDGVGNICDNCPNHPNMAQVIDGMMQEDDPDGDFVGTACETHPRCAQNRADPRPFSFYEVSADNMCCTVQLVEENGELVNPLTGRQLVDPCGRPVTTTCQEQHDLLDPYCDDLAEGLCRRLPNAVAARPGVLTPPPGCEAALADAGYSSPLDNPRLTPADVDQDLEAFWRHQCFLPQWDQDFDGIGDMCDLCPFEFDPENRGFIDANGRLHPNSGFYCFGQFHPDNAPWCTQTDDVGETEGETEGETDGDDMGTGGADDDDGGVG